MIRPFLVILICLAPILAQNPEVIALNRLASSGISESEAFALTNALRTELGKTGKYRVMERAQMDEILKEQGFQQSGACDEASCAMEIGQLLAVKYVVVGSIGQVGKTFTLNIRLARYALFRRLTGEINRLDDLIERKKGKTRESRRVRRQAAVEIVRKTKQRDREHAYLKDAIEKLQFIEPTVELRFDALDMEAIQRLKRHPIVQQVGKTDMSDADIRVVLA